MFLLSWLPMKLCYFSATSLATCLKSNTASATGEKGTPTDLAYGTLSFRREKGILKTRFAQTVYKSYPFPGSQLAQVCNGEIVKCRRKGPFRLGSLSKGAYFIQVGHTAAKTWSGSDYHYLSFWQGLFTQKSWILFVQTLAYWAGSYHPNCICDHLSLYQRLRSVF